MTSFQSTPFQRRYQLNKELDFLDNGLKQDCEEGLPDQPTIRLVNESHILEYLERDLYATDLESIASYLWWMSTPCHSNIGTLHHQKVKSREVVVTEDPRLHLVWINERIFVKPIPKYLLSEAFWAKYFNCDYESSAYPRTQVLRKAALGYLRTYRYLIRYESDFHLARKEALRLIPPDVTWVEVCRFLQCLENITDADVSERYHFGEIRLTRLNFYSKFLLRKWHYARLHGQYGDYFSRFYGPLLFILGIFSVVFSASQVVMAVEQLTVSKELQWVKFWWFSRWFGISVIAILFVLSFCILMVLLAMIAHEWQFALRKRYGKKR
jgi:hypothetical protein